MKTKTIIKLLFTAAALAVLVSFAGCSLAATEVDETALDRRANPERGRQPTEFTAVVELSQVIGSAETKKLGNSNQFRTTGEILTGSIQSSEWNFLDGAYVVMTNFTNFEGIPVDGFPRDFYYLSGTNHSKIKIFKGEKLILEMNANGKIEGDLLNGAALSMKWNTIGPGPNARGNLDGTFSWTEPSSQFTISGFYIE